MNDSKPGWRRFLVFSLLSLIGVMGPSAHVQLDSSCFVSALNRTAQVEPDGTWVLPNVPANLGRVRLRATCVREGQVTSGQSDFVDVPANGVIQVSEIRFDLQEPVPERLVLTAPQTSLTSVGETVPVTATAEFADLPSVDVSLGAAGTTYRSSDPSTAAVSPDGLPDPPGGSSLRDHGTGAPCRWRSSAPGAGPGHRRS